MTDHTLREHLCYKESLEMDSPLQTEQGMPKKHLWVMFRLRRRIRAVHHTQKASLGQEEVKEGDHCWPMLQEEIRA